MAKNEQSPKREYLTAEEITAACDGFDKMLEQGLNFEMSMGVNGTQMNWTTNRLPTNPLEREQRKRQQRVARAAEKRRSQSQQGGL